VIDAIANTINAAKTAAAENRNKDDYEHDGIWYCGKCGTPKEIKIMLMGQERLMPCDCDCMANEYADNQIKLKKAQREQSISRNKSVGIKNKELYSWTFENGEETQAIATARKYVTKWAQMYQDNIGLMFYGNPGTGKTYAAMCIANALLDMGVSVMVTNFSHIIATLSDYKVNNNEYIDDLNTYSLLIIDDIGSERNTETATQYVTDVIDARVRANKPLIVTTNLTVEEMKQAQDISKQRIYSRILGVTLPVKAVGEDIRLKKQKNKLRAAQAMFEQVAE